MQPSDTLLCSQQGQLAQCPSANLDFTSPTSQRGGNGLSKVQQVLYPKTEHGCNSAMEAKGRSLALATICVGYGGYSALTSVLVLFWLRDTGRVCGSNP